MSNFIFERPLASRFQNDNKTLNDNQTNFNYLNVSSDIHSQFHYDNNIIGQNITFNQLKPISTREEKKVSVEQQKNDYAKKPMATIYNK